ncbi:MULTISPECIES: ABC transporter permease subunit [Bifidobacterium]|uniref:ABC transporter permease subunit n=1 Tax=Bifidobacterium TaxID=1678 RepID=UPI00052992D8|nr:MULTISPECIES: carboxypeptidase regulatory-like domain-containing protein [Bifidobacterium]MDC7285620.1 carboxypeptidase regulatory-like domain-containing protein [Bifidobacterium thermophilum]MDY5368306.1 carboxypeptidase regulatory-like domain-containing protein [Bifidobacterium sp.]
MADALSTARRHRFLILTCMLAMLVPMAFLAFPSSAQAAEAVTTCNPTATNGCVNGILQDASKQPVAGATVTLSGKESATTTTDSTGKWAFSVTADGSYTVTIDKSVASSHGLPGNTATVSIDKSDFSKQRAVVRFDKANVTDSSSSGKASGSASSSSKAKSGSSSSTTDSSSASSSSGSSSNFGQRFWQQLYSGLIFGLMLALMSVGMNLVYGTTGLSSFSHGEQVTLGGLMAYVGTQMLHWPLIVSGIFAIAIGALTGLIQNEVIWAPLRRKHVGPLQQMIVTIGLSMVLQYLFQFFFGGSTKGIVTSVERGFQIGPITTDRATLISAAIAIVVIVTVTYFLYHTRFGRATRAVSDNAALAAASGINVEHVVRIVWILSCALAALSGVLMGIYLNGIAWNTGAVLLLLMFSAVTLGGLGTAPGALVGALIIGVVADMSSLIIPNDMRYASALAILIIVLLFRPQGIFGKAQRVG